MTALRWGIDNCRLTSIQIKINITLIYTLWSPCNAVERIFRVYLNRKGGEPARFMRLDKGKKRQVQQCRENE